MQKLNWLSETSPKKRKLERNIDVSLNIAKYASEKSNRVQFTFYCDIEKISKTGWFDLAKVNHRIYFREMPEGKGYKVNMSAKKDYSTFRVVHRKLPIYTNDVGDYILYFDDELKLPYINLMHTQQKENH